MKKNSGSAISAFALCVLMHAAHGQVVYKPGSPPSWSLPQLTTSLAVSTLPAFDADAVRKEDAANDLQKSIPYRFAIPHPVNLNTRNSGRWENLPNGDRLWRIELSSPGATTMNVIFDEFRLVGSAEVYLYNAGKTHFIGPFTAQNNLPWGSLATIPVEGDAVVVEYLEPAGLADAGNLSIGQVAHGYRGFHGGKAMGLGDSGPCNNNVICKEWDEWRCQIKSEVLLLNNGSSFCSGTLINNTSQDGAPLILTANHCTGNSVANWAFLFNWDSPTCTPTTNAPRDQSVSGATLLAKNAGSDFSLVQMSSKPPATYNVYYAGWDATGDALKSEVGIHHPAGDIKKISLDSDPGAKSTWSGAQVWRVTWNDGTTEPGSSGSGLFDQNRRVIGQLFGGGASCDNTNSSDNYGRLEISWGLGASKFLDPGNTGLKKVDGLGTGVCAGNAVTAAFRPGAAKSCDGKVAFTDQSSNALSWSWNFGDNGTSTQQNPTHTYAAGGKYTVKLVIQGTAGAMDTATADVNVTVMGSLAAAGDSICPGDRATLTAAAGAGTLVGWYSAPSGGNLVGTGSPFLTPALNIATTYYAEAVEDKAAQKVGPASNSIGAGGYYTSGTNQGLYFTALTPGVLKSVKVYANSPGNRTIELQNDSNVMVASKTVIVPQGENRITLDFPLAPGGYFLKVAGSSTVDLYRNTAGAAFPYTAPDLVSITRSNSTNTAYYYFFYDWEVQGEVCRTARVPVVVKMKPAGCLTGLANVGWEGGFSVFPELNNGIVFVNNPKEVAMEVVNILGESVRSVQLHPGQNRVDLRELRDGVYLLRIHSPHRVTRRIVKGM